MAVSSARASSSAMGSKSESSFITGEGRAEREVVWLGFGGVLTKFGVIVNNFHFGFGVLYGFAGVVGGLSICREGNARIVRIR